MEVEHGKESQKEQVENLDSYTLSFIKSGHIDIPDMANFDPKGELEEIKKAVNQFPKDGQSRERKILMDEYKKKLKIFRESMSNAQVAMESIIIKDPDRDHQELIKEVRQILDHYNLQSQADAFFGALKNYLDAHMIVKKVASDYQKDVGKNWQSALFVKLFGRFPNGRVEVEVLPMALYFKIFDEIDYALAYYKHEPDKAELESSNSTYGAIIHRELPIHWLNNSVIIGNNGKGNLDMKSEEIDLKIHEEEHAIHSRLYPTSTMIRQERESDMLVSYEGENSSYESFVSKVKNFSRGYIRKWENSGKSEVLAWLKEGKSFKEIAMNLLDPKTLYNYLKFWEDDISFVSIVVGHLKKLGVTVRNKNGKILKEKEIENIAARAIKEAWELYKKNLSKAMEAAISLQRQYEDDPERDIKLLRLLSQEPLAKWHRLKKIMS